MSSGTPIKPNNRKDAEGTFFTPKPIMLTQTMRKNDVKPLGTPGMDASIGSDNSVVVKQLFNGGRRRSNKRKTRKARSKKRSTIRRA
jgi:hypothetical protein